MDHLNIQHFFDKQGFLQIGFNILNNLDFKTQLACRLVCKSWKNVLEDPRLNYKITTFWLEKCQSKGIFKHSMEQWKTFLTSAREEGLHTIIKFMLIRIFNSEPNLNYDFYTPLHIFASIGNLYMVQQLTAEKWANSTNSDFSSLYTPLHEAAANGQLHVVKYLATIFDLNQKDDDGITALLLAAKKGCVKTVKFLAEKSESPFVVDNFGFNVIHVAVMYGHIEIIELFVRNTEEFFIKESNESALEHNTTHSGQSKIITLMSKISHHTFQYDIGSTPIHEAKAKLRWHYNILEKKIKKKSIQLMFVENNNGLSPIHLAAACGKLDILKYFSKVSRSFGSFHVINKPSNIGWTSLHLAVANNRKEIVKFLIRSCNARNYTDNLGNSPIHLAAEKNRVAILKLLMEIDHNLDAQNSQGHTPLHLAALHGSIGIVKCLLSHTKKKHLKDDFGNTPKALALQNNHTEIAMLL